MPPKRNYAQAALETHEEQKASGTAAGAARGGKRMAVLQAPIWQPGKLGAKARAGKIGEQQLAEVMMALTAMTPDGTRIPNEPIMSPFLVWRLFRLLYLSRDSNPLWTNNADFMDEVYANFAELNYDSVYSDDAEAAEVVVLAAVMGADPKTLPPEDKWVSSQTLQDGVDDPATAAIPAVSRNPDQLIAYGLASASMATEQGQAICLCGAPTQYIAPRQWRAGATPSPASFSCASGKCRYVMQLPAYSQLRTIMGIARFDQLPLLWCRSHPSATIQYRQDSVKADKEGDEDIKLIKVRCTHYEKVEGAARPKYCDAQAYFGDALGPVSYPFLRALTVLGAYL